MKAEWLRVFVAVVGIMAVSGGCLDFDEQKARIEHDEENDRLIVILDYRGIYASDHDAKGAMEQLEEALEGKTVAFFANWPCAFTLEDLKDELQDPEKREEPEVSSKSEELGLSQEGRKMLLALLERMRVLNGGFYLDPAGRLCAAQVLVLEQAEDSVRLANEFISDAAIRELEEEKREFPESLDQSGKLILNAIRDGHTWLQTKGHSLMLSIPCPEEEFQEAREEFVEGMLDEMTKSEAHLRALGDLLASPVLVWHEDSMFKVKCGLQSRPSVLVLKPREGDYEPNLVASVTEKYGLHLDANLARYLVDPNADAQTEGETAARMMATRLTKLQRMRVLVGQLEREPTEACWARLREEPFERVIQTEMLIDGELLDELRKEGPPDEWTNEKLLDEWTKWLAEQTAVPVAEPDEPPQE